MLSTRATRVNCSLFLHPCYISCLNPVHLWRTFTEPQRRRRDTSSSVNRFRNAELQMCRCLAAGTHIQASERCFFSSSEGQLRARDQPRPQGSAHTAVQRARTALGAAQSVLTSSLPSLLRSRHLSIVHTANVSANVVQVYGKQEKSYA